MRLIKQQSTITGRQWATSFLLATLLLLSLVFAPISASAHGASVVQVDSDLGAYHVVVVTSSASTTNSGLLLTVVLTEAPTDPSDLTPHPVTGATVNASITSGSSLIVVPVPSEANRASEGYYETNLNIPGEGDAPVTLQIDGTRGPASTTFTVTRSAPWIGWLTFAAELIFAGAIVTYLLIFAANTLRARRKPNPSSDLPTT